MQKLQWTKQMLRRRLPEEGNPGVTQYCAPGDVPQLDRALLPDEAAPALEAASASPTGCAFIAPDGAPALLIVPPFPVPATTRFSEVHASPLLELVERRRSIAVFLLRLGGFSVGFFRGDELIDSKTDQRFVKNRHRKGGQSQRRFERIREKQIDELFGKACEVAQEKLAPYEAEIEHVFFGGDRHTLQAFRKQCHYFDRYGSRLMARVLPVPGDPRRASLEAMPRAVTSCDVWLLGEDEAAQPDAPQSDA